MTLATAIFLIQQERDAAAKYLEENDVEGKWLDEHGSLKDWESGEEYAAATATVETYDKALGFLLQIGETP